MPRKSKFKFANNADRERINTPPVESGQTEQPEKLYVKFVKDFSGSFGMTMIKAKSGEYHYYKHNVVSYLKQFGAIECQ